MENCLNALNTGGVVIFPTDTVYGLLARQDIPVATQKIYALKGRASDKPLVRMISSLDRDDALLSTLPRRAWRVMHSLCPGPLTIVGEGTSSVRWANHKDLNELIRQSEGPLVCSSANLSEGKEARQLSDIPAPIREGVDAHYDGGLCEGGVASTVLRFNRNSFELLREGPLKESLIQYLWCYRLAFVCTGNTCRSPMAEAMARKLLCQKLSCKDLLDHGIHIESAGVHAAEASPASQQSVEVMKSMGLDVSTHLSSNVSHFSLCPPDQVYGMTSSHVAILNSMAIDAELLSKNGEDVADPFGGSLTRYQGCAEQIYNFIVERVDEWISQNSLLDSK